MPARRRTPDRIFGPHAVARYGSEERKRRTLISGEDRTSFAVTEPDAGLSTTDIKTFARREGERYMVNGRKVRISTAQVANKILQVTRTTPKSECSKRTDGITLSYRPGPQQVTVGEIDKMGRNAINSNELFIDGLEVPVEDRIGEEGKGFKYLLHRLDADRIVVEAGLLGGTRSVLDCVVRYANYQAIQHPLAEKSQCPKVLPSYEVLDQLKK